MAQNTIDLKKIHAEHPECFEDSVQFKAYLLDLYPEEKKAKVNVLTTLLEQGVLRLVKNGSILEGFAFCKQICDDYGFNESLVNECFALFAEMFNGNNSTVGVTKNIAPTVLPPDYPTLTNYNKSEFVINGTVLNKYTGRGGNVKIPFGVTTIGEEAFCLEGFMISHKIINVVIPESVTSIGWGAFIRCGGLTSITIPGSVTSIGSFAFAHCSNLTSVVISDGVTSIGQSAFQNCPSLTKITIPNSVASIGIMAFCECSSLENITIPNNLTAIGEKMFKNCSSLEHIIIPDKVKSIGLEAFSSCDCLISIVIPDSVTSIGESAFDYCPSLTTVYCETAAKPQNWHRNWKGYCFEAKIVWGYKK